MLPEDKRMLIVVELHASFNGTNANILNNSWGFKKDRMF